MNHISLNLIINIVTLIIGAATVVVGSIQANRTVKEGVQLEAAQRRRLSAIAVGA